MTAKKAGAFGIADTIRDAFAYLSRAYRALPVFVRNVLQRRIETVQVVDGRARFAAQQVAHFVADATVVVILDVSCHKRELEQTY